MPQSPTRKALEGSIKKWQDIVKGTGIDRGIANCPLCHMFYRKGCEGCPVMGRTERRACHGTPYHLCLVHHEMKYAEKEVAFLISLRKDVK